MIPINAQKSQLRIDCSNEIYENEDFSVSVYILNKNNSPEYQIDVEIELNNEIFMTTEEYPELILKAPNVENDGFYDILARKKGFYSNNSTILIKNKLKLIVIPDSYTINENEQFSVIVKDENNNPVENATVAIQSCSGKDSIGISNVNGRIWLTSPNDREEILIRAKKDGYIDGVSTIRINKNIGIIEGLIQRPYAPVFLAFLVLLFAIIYVNYRKKKSIVFFKQDHISNNQKNLENKSDSSFFISDNTKKMGDKSEFKRNIESSYNTKGPKIEEIRIKRTSKEKDIVSMDNDNLKNNVNRKIMDKYNIKNNDEWFKGSNDSKYKIDKYSTNEIEKEIDRWFEGTNDIKNKLDKRVKKKDNK
jgi:hypothetical protein